MKMSKRLMKPHKMKLQQDPVGGMFRTYNGNWARVNLGWQEILVNSTLISENEAYLLLGIKKKPISS